MLDLERQRLDLLAKNKRLYDYIAATESARALNEVADSLAAYDQYASNAIWVKAGEAMGRALQLLNEPIRN